MVVRETVFRKVPEKMINELIDRIDSFIPEGIYIQLPDKKLGDGEIGVVIKKYETLKRVILDPEMGFGEEYMKGNIEIKGSLEKLLVGGISYLNSIEEEKEHKESTRLMLNFIGLLKKIEEKEVQHHYDFGNDFMRYGLTNL